MIKIIFILLSLLLSFAVNANCQKQTDIDQPWKWIIPLKTQKTEIEMAFGNSITEDKNNPFQTYVAEFGKITVTYALTNKFIRECACTVNAGTVLETFVSPKRFKLSDLKIDITKFKKDVTFSPREISYFNAEEGILIDTEIVELRDKTKIERVVAIEYRPKVRVSKKN